MFRVSSSACTVPSSPPGPCRQMKAASGEISISVPVVVSSMSSGWTSWPRRSRACWTRLPVRKETSRSIECPPRKTATRATKPLTFRARVEACRAAAVDRAFLPVRAAFQVAPELHALPDHLGEQLYAAPDPLWLHEREVEPHVVLAHPRSAPVESLARHVGDVPGYGAGEHRGRIQVRGEGGPHEEPALRVGPVDLFGHELGQGVEHRVAALLVHGGQAPDVGPPVRVLEVRGDHHLRKVRGAEVGALLADVDLVQYPRLGVHPPESDAGGEDLGERPEIDDPVEVSLFLLQRREGGERLAFEAEHPVGVVLHDHEIELARHLQELPAPLGDHRNPSRVLEVGDSVEELDVEPAFAGLLEGLAGSDGDNAGPIHRGVGYAWPVGGESVERPSVGRPLAQDCVALVEEDLGDEVEPLLGSCRDEDVLLPRRRALRAHDLDYDVFYGFEARRRPVLQGLGRVRSDVPGDLTERLFPEGPRVRKSASQRDDARPRERGHKVAGRGRLHALDPVGIQEIESVEIYERQGLSPRALAENRILTLCISSFSTLTSCMDATVS